MHAVSQSEGGIYLALLISELYRRFINAFSSIQLSLELP